MPGVAVTVRWGDTVLVSREVEEGGEAWIGGGEDSLSPIPCEALGVSRAKVAGACGKVPVAIVPEGAVGFHEKPGALPAPVGGPAEVVLTPGETVSFTIGTFLVTVAASRAEELPWTRRSRVRGALVPGAYAAVAAGVHAAVLLVSAQSASAASFEPDPALDRMAQYLASADARAAANEQVIASRDGGSQSKLVDGKDGSGGENGGARAAGREGKSGGQSQRGSREGRYSVSGGEKRNEGVSRADAVADARSFGLAGVLSAEGSRAPFASFGEVAAKGMDAFGTRGDLWASSIGETFGAGGLSLSGVGEGGGGRFEGIGLGSIGIGHGDGAGSYTGGGGTGLFAHRTWDGQWVDSVCYGGNRRCRLGSLRAPIVVSYGAPSVRSLRADSTYPDAGQFARAARQANSALRACYAPLVSWDPEKQEGSAPSGTVITNLVIDENGRVVTAGNAASTFRGPEIAVCVMNALRSVSYPVRPGLGAVGAQIPIGFSVSFPSK